MVRIILEFLIIFIPPIGWICWTIGGFKWKWVRRFLWPGIAVASLFLSQAPPGVAFATGVLMIATLSLGYGDNSKLRRILGKWPTFILVGCLYSLSVSLVGVSIWHMLLAVWFPIGTALSQNKASLHWKIVEGFTGLLQGLCIL